MAKAKKNCRVCGKLYDACKTESKDIGAFVWREVACSIECGGIYLSRILESRTEEATPLPSPIADIPAPEAKPKQKRRQAKPKAVPEEVLVQDNFSSPEPLSEVVSVWQTGGETTEAAGEE